MPHRIIRSLALATVLGLSGSCAGHVLGVRDGGLERVDELLSSVERVEVEAALSKERSAAAMEKLRALLAPEFRGDPSTAHAELVTAIEASQDQAKAFRRTVRPLRNNGERVFAGWAENLESFGNLAMRQRSQERLEETRRRYDAILAAAGSVQLAFDAFNGDLEDQALFLEHDFNATAVGLASQELEGLKSRAKELTKRLDACAATCQAYVEFSAPSAELAPAAEPAPPAAQAAPQQAAPAPAPAAPVKKPAPRKKAGAQG